MGDDDDDGCGTLSGAGRTGTVSGELLLLVAVTNDADRPSAKATRCTRYRLPFVTPFNKKARGSLLLMAARSR